jgi:DNA-binding response OmpR family regulator
MPDVLLVTDAEWVRNDVEAAIAHPSTSITVVDDPGRAAAAAANQTYDLIVVDMQVRSMGGMAIVRRLKDAIATENVASTPILLMLDREADRFLAKRAGADIHLLKPFTAQDFRTAVDSLVST